MRKNFGAKPWTYPQPVFILAAYDENGTPNAMNAAWGGISEDKELSMCISEGHKTTANILARKAFTVSMATVEQMVACDYVGIESGNKVADKVAKAGWHTTKSEFVDAPLIDELPMAVECRLVSYDPESCRLVGEIVNVSADESVLNEDGKIDPDKLRPITFDPIHNAYRVLGEKVGNAFQDGAIQVGNVFGFIVYIENVLQKTRTGAKLLPLSFFTAEYIIFISINLNVCSRTFN